ncbi:MAG: STAS domain-containing protein [Marinisporobacter sp.]|jgi:anti-sigma B factor antagonist|nr:STAS domain-containing protein [Marinisporobacter sp.]
MDIFLKDNIFIFKIKTDLTATTIKGLLINIKNQIDEYKEYEGIEINLEEVKSIDSMGITFLIGIYKIVNKENKKFKLTGVSEAMLKLFKTMKLHEIVEIEKA